MNRALREELTRELLLRGFKPGGSSPNDTMILDDQFLADVSIGDLLETMVARREKVFRSDQVVGSQVAKKSYDDVVLVIEVIKNVLDKLRL